MSNSPKRRKRERVNRRFVEGVLEELAADSSRTLLRFVCAPSYGDPRPFRWAGMDVHTEFTYHLPVDDDPEGLLRSFSKSLRREIRDLEETDLTVGVAEDARSAASEVYEDIASRYDEQGEPFPLTEAYVLDLVEALGDRCRVYVARDGDGAYLTGVIVFYSNDAAYYWEGGARATYDDASVNSLLHWTVVRDVAVDPELEPVTRYDMVGANTPRLCRYKAKFSPELVPYYVVESGGATMDLAKTAYGWLKG
jgi:lipid II:glycine glycyltransferase (peptidoglycan interpeptide bridge formation enzyme)